MRNTSFIICTPIAAQSFVSAAMNFKYIVMKSTLRVRKNGNPNKTLNLDLKNRLVETANSRLKVQEDLYDLSGT